MSQKFPGGFVTKSPVAPTTSAASGIWTLDQQEQYQKAGTWPSPPPPPYIEDVFSTYLYTGNGSTQTITNGIDLAGDGGLVWIKSRGTTDGVPRNHGFWDTTRGAGTSETSANNKALSSNLTSAQGLASNADYVSAFGATGFDVTAASSPPTSAFRLNNGSGVTYASWTFRKQPKFFDVQTFTAASGSFSATFSHNLGSIPGCVIFKSTTNGTANWYVWHTSIPSDSLYLNTTGAKLAQGSGWLTATSTTVSINGVLPVDNATYVAYLFAHDAGGFGATETENVISCGSFTPDSSGNVDVNLGYEPQWILFKRSAVAGSWSIADTMRGMSYSDFNRLYANLSNAEDAQPAAYCVPTATGFKSVTTGVFSANEPHIYIAIRRGPMKVPTSGTSVFAPVANTQSSGTVRTIGFPADLAISTGRTTNLQRMFNDRLRGFSQTNTSTGPRLFSNTTDAETTSFTGVGAVTNTGYQDGDYFDPGISMIRYLFGRAPGFFDEVCYRGTGVAPLELSHNLGAVPELMIVKNRTSAYDWFVYSAALGNNSYLRLNTTAAVASNYYAWADTTPTSTKFTVGALDNVNGSVGFYYVAYLFATCAGVSKVGSYTGDSTSDVVVNCGFTAGARFVLIKRTDAAGDWYVYDSARGINPSNDPYLLLNSNAAEVTGTNYIGPYSTGFYVNTGSPLNAATGATYIYLAIA